MLRSRRRARKKSKVVNRRRRSKKEILGELIKSTWGLMTRSVSWLVLIGFVLGVPGFIVYNWDTILDLPLFDVAKVEIYGNDALENEQVMAILGVVEGETSVFAVDPRAAEHELAAHPWVESVKVERVLPDRIRVNIEERQIGGLVMLEQLYIADTNGAPFKPIEHESNVDVAIVTGIGVKDPSQITDAHKALIKDGFALMQMYDEAGLGAFDGLSEVQVDPIVGSTLVTEKRFVRVHLGQGRLKERLARLGEVFDELDRRKMKARTIRLDSERSLDRVAILLEKSDDISVKP